MDYGASLGCQASSTVTVTAESEEEKLMVDEAAKVSYANLFSTTSNFTAVMNSTRGFKGLSVSATVRGGNVSTAVFSIEDVKTKTLEPLDSGTACTTHTAIVSRVLIQSWLLLPAISELVDTNHSISEALKPPNLSPDTLEQMNEVIMTGRTYSNIADRCSQNVYDCVTKQWNEPNDTRKAYYASASKNLMIFQSEIDKLTQDSLTLDTVDQYKMTLECIYTN